MADQYQALGGKRKTALITGASAGLGKAFAELLAAEGFDLVLTARRKDRLNALAQELSEKFSVSTEVIVADLADPNAPGFIFDTLSEKNIAIQFLINNAGYSIDSSFADAPLQAQLDLVQVMITAVVKLCHLFLPEMKNQGYGKIINVSSLAAFVSPIPGRLYSGIKSFVLDYTASLAFELEGTGVTATALCPGFTHTEFHDAMGVRDQVRKLPGFIWMESETVVRQGYRAAMKGETVCIPGRINRILAACFGLLPIGLKYKAKKIQSLTRTPSEE